MSKPDSDITLFGIKNCDTVKKARTWLNINDITFHFHDFRSDGITTELINSWLNDVPVEKLLNKKSTTWRQLDPDQQQQAETDQLADLLIANPTLVKRPVITINGRAHVGFKPDQYAGIFSE